MIPTITPVDSSLTTVVVRAAIHAAPIVSIALSTFVASIVAARPIEMHILFELGDDGMVENGPDYNDAFFDLMYRWDAATLTPSYVGNALVEGNWRTTWPSTNTVGSLEITGSADDDGVHPLEHVVGSCPAGKPDVVSIPDAVRFTINGTSMSLFLDEMKFRGDFITVSDSPILPQPFAPDDVVEWGVAELAIEGGPRLISTAVSGYAVLVPEPPTLAIVASGFLTFAATRRLTG